MALTINPNACPANHSCPSINVCPMDAIMQEGISLPSIDADKCTECGACVSFCPKGAIIPQ